MTDRLIKVLLIEDNLGDARLIEVMLSLVSGTLFDVENANRLSDGLKHLSEGGIDAVLLDLGLPDSSGLDTFEKVHDQAPEVPIVMLTGLDDTELALEGVRMGAQDYLVKGRVDGDLLARTLRYAIERKSAEERIEHLNSVLKAIRNVNQLIVTETERDGLLRKSCDALVDARGYDAVWLGSLRDCETFDMVVGSGFREDVAHFSDRITGGDHPPCIRDALSQKEQVLVIDRTDVCRDCFFRDTCLGRSAAVIHVEHADRLFGLLAVSFAPDVAVDDEEKGLLAEVASDIGIALHNSEITEARKVAEDALLESEMKYRIVVEQTGHLVYDYDVASGSITWSGAIESITGYTNDEFQHVNIDLWGEHTHPDDRERVLDILNEAMRAETQYTVEYRFRRKDGAYTHVDDHGLFIRDRHGKMRRMLGFMYDITERKVAEEALLESEERFRMMFENMGNAVAVYDAVDCGNDFIFKDFNQSAEKIDDMQREDLIGKSVLDVFPGVVDFGLFDLFQRVWQTGEPEHHPLSFYEDTRIAGWRENYVYKLPSGEVVAIYEDVTERKVAEDALLESEGKLRLIAENMPVMLDAFDDKGNIIVWNSECEKVTGFNAGDIINNPNSGKMLYPDKDCKNYVHSMLGEYGGNFRNLEWDITCEDGSTRTILWSNISEKYPIPGWHSWAIGTDITERKVAEEMLRVAGERFKTIVETAPSVLMISDAGGSNTYISPNCEEFTGYDPDELTGGIMQWVHEDDAKRAKEIFDRTFSRGVGCKDFEYKAVKKNGDVWYASSSWEPLIGAKGEFRGAVFQTIDVTERKSAEEAIKESKSRYKHLYSMVRLMCDNLPDLIWTKDLEGNFIFVNKAFCDILLNAKDTDEPIGKDDTYFARREKENHPENPDYHTFGVTCVDSDSMVVRTKKPQRFEESGNVKGEFIYLDVYKAPFWDEDYTMLGTVGCARVVTKEKEMEEARRKAEEEIKRSLREKETLLREIHHRVKNNLQVVSSLLSMQARTVKDEDTIEILSESRNRINAMSLIHSQLYESSNLSNINIKKFVDGLLSQLLQTYPGQDAKITSDIRVVDCPFPISLAVPLGLVINELLTNVLKHAFGGRREGTIKVALDVSEDGGVNLRISDDGVGMPEYFNIDVTGTLGLRLVKILVEEQLQGDLSIASDGVGTTVEMNFVVEGESSW